MPLRWRTGVTGVAITLYVDAMLPPYLLIRAALQAIQRAIAACHAAAMLLICQRDYAMLPLRYAMLF